MKLGFISLVGALALSCLALGAPAVAAAGDLSTSVYGGVTDTKAGDAGFRVSTDITPYIAAEGSFDRTFTPVKGFDALKDAVINHPTASQFGADLAFKYPLTSHITAIAFGGAGYQLATGATEPYWDAGAGARLKIVGGLSLEARYRRTQPFKGGPAANAILGGVVLTF